MENDSEIEAKNRDLDFQNILEIIKGLNDEQIIQDFVNERLNYLENHSTKKSISIIDNGEMNGTIVNGYINSESPITSSFLVDPFYMNDPTLYVDFLKFIKNKEMNHPLQFIHELQNFTTDEFGAKGNQRIRQEIYINHEDLKDKISISDFYKNNSALCSERSASIQNLASFMGINSYFVLGKMKSTENKNPESHAYNILKKKDGTLILFDSTNKITLLKDGNLGLVPAFHIFEKGTTIEDLTEINFDSQKLAKYYDLELHPDEPTRTYYTPSYKN